MSSSTYTEINGFKIHSVSAPRWADETHSSIDVIVEFSHCGVVPFTASPNDVEDHGKVIYEAALRGDFGEIAPYVPPAH